MIGIPVRRSSTSFRQLFRGIFVSIAVADEVLIGEQVLIEPVDTAEESVVSGLLHMALDLAAGRFSHRVELREIHVRIQSWIFEARDDECRRSQIDAGRVQSGGQRVGEVPAHLFTNR